MGWKPGWSSKFRPILATQEPLTVFHWTKQKKIQNGRLKKTTFFKTTFFKTVNSQYFFVKFSGIGSWVSRINWCEGHQCDSTDMVVRLSDIRPKTGKWLPWFPAYEVLGQHPCTGLYLMIILKVTKSTLISQDLIHLRSFNPT